MTIHDLATVLIGVGVVGGCALEDDAASSDAIASVSLASGVTVEFYEPSPGELLVVQSARAGVTPLQLTADHPLELWHELAPDRPAPEALVQAQAHLDEAARDPVVARPALTATGSVAAAHDAHPVYFIDNQSCDDHWFSDTFCGGSYDWQMCLLNHWDGAYAKSGGVHHAYYSACADIGNITLQVKMGSGDGGIWDITEGTYRYYSWFAASPFFWDSSSTRGDILNATNNRFHYFAGYWD